MNTWLRKKYLIEYGSVNGCEKRQELTITHNMVNQGRPDSYVVVTIIIEP